MTSKEPEFVFVHGAWHGAWVWDAVLGLLEARSRHGVAVELPGRADPGTVGQVTLDDAASTVVQALRSSSRPVTLVAHSMGGVVATQAAEMAGDLIESLVYVAAFVPPNGKNVLDIASVAEFETSLAARYQEVDPVAGTSQIVVERRGEVFYGTCSPGAAEDAAARLVPESLQLSTTPVVTSPQRWGSVRRAYIETLQDHALPIGFQRLQQRSIGFDTVRTMDTDHSPFLSSPAEFTTLLLGVTDRFRGTAISE